VGIGEVGGGGWGGGGGGGGGGCILDIQMNIVILGCNLNCLKKERPLSS